MSSEMREIALGERAVTIEDVVDVAAARAVPVLSTDRVVRARLEASAAVITRRVADGPPVYGVTTGFGASCETDVPAAVAGLMPLNLLRYHGVGTGRPLADDESAAVLLIRAASLVGGYSAVRPLLIERLCKLAALRALPVIPSEGSVGASGDLTPLSYVAAALVGERELRVEGRTLAAADALAQLGLEPLTLAPKESLAVMNGTSVMTALACLAHARSARLSRLGAALTAMAVDVLHGQPAHFDARLFDAKPHPGQRAVAAWIRADLDVAARPEPRAGRIQDRYSIRCAPHVVGVLVDALTFSRSWLEIEINGANDNPLVDPETGDVLHGGNFYGGHVAFVADSLKTAVANVADLLDRQVALLLSPNTNAGLPENLVAVPGPERVAHHGFKAMEIATSALAAEALKNAAPASVFSRSTEGHNQDKVSMGTIAARDLCRVVELTETVAAIHLLALCQAVDLRGLDGVHGRARALHGAVRAQVAMNRGDRRMDGDIEHVLAMLRSDQLPIGSDT